MFSESEQRAVRSIWLLDNAGNLNNEMSLQTKSLVNDLTESRAQLAHIDHEILGKISINKPWDARTFIINGACRHQNQLNSLDALKLVLKVFTSSDHNRGDLLKYLRDNESHISPENYSSLFNAYIEHAISDNRIQQDLFDQTLSLKQSLQLEDYLKRHHPQVLVAKKLWDREVCKAIGLAMNESMSSSSESVIGNKIAHSYFVTMTKER